MGHFAVTCAKKAEPIEMLFWVNTRVSPMSGPKEPCIRWGCRSPREGAIFGGCPGHSKVLAIFAAAVAAASLRLSAKGIIQSPITSCSRRDHSVYQASANSILKIFGCRRCSLSSAKGVVGLQRGWSLISMLALFGIDPFCCIYHSRYFQYVWMGQITPKIAPSRWGSRSHLISGSFGLHDAAHKRHLDRFSCFCTAYPCKPCLHRQTTLRTKSMTISSIHAVQATGTKTDQGRWSKGK